MAVSRMRRLWWRWDAPDTRPWHAGSFAVVALSWVGIVAIVVVLAVRWDLFRYVAPFLGACIGSAIGGTARHCGKQRNAAAQLPVMPSLTPSRPSDATDDPWRFPSS
jgi:hypothetical protein